MVVWQRAGKATVCVTDISATQVKMLPRSKATFRCYSGPCVTLSPTAVFSKNAKGRKEKTCTVIYLDFVAQGEHIHRYKNKIHYIKYFKKLHIFFPEETELSMNTDLMTEESAMHNVIKYNFVNFLQKV